MKVLVIGYGSIGQRHARLLLDLGYQVAIVSRRSVDYSPCYSNLEQALVEWYADYIIIANRTSEHCETFKRLVELEFKGLVLIEKPLFSQNLPIPQHCFSRVAVAYNLRFHPLLQQLKQIVDSDSKIITVNVYVGSYLPNWRSLTDYRQSYSASRKEGGGVLQDLSHELDYILWIFGDWQRLTAIGGQFSHLEIDSDDVYSLLMETQYSPLVSIHMNYLDRSPRREISINTEKQTVDINLIQGIISVNGHQTKIQVHQDYSYIAEHQALIAGDLSTICSLEDARKTLGTIEAAENAATLKRWIQK